MKLALRLYDYLGNAKDFTFTDQSSVNWLKGRYFPSQPVRRLSRDSKLRLSGSIYNFSNIADLFFGGLPPVAWEVVQRSSGEALNGLSSNTFRILEELYDDIIYPKSGAIEGSQDPNYNFFRSSDAGRVISRVARPSSMGTLSLLERLGVSRLLYWTANLSKALSEKRIMVSSNVVPSGLRLETDGSKKAIGWSGVTFFYTEERHLENTPLEENAVFPLNPLELETSDLPLAPVGSFLFRDGGREYYYRLHDDFGENSIFLRNSKPVDLVESFWTYPTIVRGITMDRFVKELKISILDDSKKNSKKIENKPKEEENVNMKPTNTNLSVSTNNNVFTGLEGAGKQYSGLIGISMFDQSMSYKIDGKFMALKKGKLVDMTGMVMELPFPAFSIPTNVNDLKKKDLILVDGSPKIVYSVKNGQVKVIDSQGNVKTVVPISHALFDVGFLLKLSVPVGGDNLFGKGSDMTQMMMMSAMSGGGDQSNMMGAMMMAQMFKGKKKKKKKKKELVTNVSDQQQ